MIRVSTIFFLIVCQHLPSYGQQAFHVDHFTSQNGLPQNSVITVEFDSAGYLWCSTEAGVVKFDGTSIKVFNALSNPEFIADRGMKIIKTSKGELIIHNPKSGPFGFRSGKMVQLKEPYLQEQVFYGIKGAIPTMNLYEWIVREKIIDRYFEGKQGPYVNIFPLSDSRFLIICMDKILHFQDTALQQSFSMSAYHPVGYFMVNGKLLFLDALNHLYSLNPDNGLVTSCLLTGDRWRSIVTEHNRPNIHYESNWPFEKPFVIDGNTLYRISATADSNHFQSSRITSELPSGCVIKCIAYDELRKVFAIGTDSKGLFVFHQNSLKTALMNETAEGSNNVYYAQLPLDSSHVLAGYQRIFDSNSEEIQKWEVGDFSIFALMRDKHENIWYTTGDKIFRYSSALKKATSISKKNLADITQFYEYKDKVWIASQNGIGFIKDDSVTVFTSSDGSATHCFLQVPGKGLLTGHERGAYFLDPQTFNKDTIHALDGICVRSLESIDDLVFIGTYGKGLYLWKNNKLVKAPMDRRDNMTDVHTFFSDNKGFVWITTNKGLFKTTLASLQHFFADTTSFVYYYRYGVDDGIVSDEFNGGCNPAYARLSNGYVSLPTMQGLVWLKPEEVEAILPREGISIENILVDQKNIPVASTLQLICNYRLVEIDFSTPYFGSQENVWMDYRIEGFNEKWIQIDNNGLDLQIPTIGYGSFTLVIRKKSGFGAEDWVYYRLPVVVAPCFYQTVWFIALCIFLLAFSFWIALRISANNILQRSKKLELLVNQRTEELRNANEQLEVSVNVKDKLISIISHDIVTPLRFIGFTARMATKQEGMNNAKLTNTLGDIQNAAGKLHDNALNILNWINYQNRRIEVKPSNVAMFSMVEEIFEKVKEMADTRSNRMENTITEDDILQTDNRLLGIVLHNVISNALKHTRNGTITVSAHPEKDQYRIFIADNGDGMDADILHRINNPTSAQLLNSGKSDKDFGGSGLGYIIIDELLELLKGSYHVASERGKGTVVTILIPVLLALPVKENNEAAK